MVNTSLAAALRQMCGWTERYADTNAPDHQLLERFASQRDEAALAALLQRHGSLVLSVARRILHDAHAAEDVFQSTFLTLARRAGSIRKRESVAAWLYGVAARLAMQTRMRDRRRAARERATAPPATVEDVAEATAWRELGMILDEELLCLPDRYRAVLVLIYFAGQTQDEAARQLGWSKGTLRRRLEKGKRWLHARLLRRGVSLSVGLLVAAVGQNAAEALPPPLLRRTMEEAMRVASRGTVLCVAGIGSLTRAKIALALGLLVAAGAGVMTLQGTPREQPRAEHDENDKPPAQMAKPQRVDRFGDPLPPGAIARLGTMRLRHGNGTSVVFTSDGKSLLTCGSDLTVRTWDLASGRLLREHHLPRHHTSSPVAVLSPDGRYVAFEKLFGTLVLWDLRADKLRHEFPIQGSWPRVLFSPDNKFLVIADSEGALHVCDVATGKSRSLGQHGKRQRIDSLSFTHDGTLMSLADDKTLRFWNVKEGRERSRLTVDEPIPTAAVSPDGRIVAVTTYLDQDSVRFWDAATGKPVKDWKDWGGRKGQPLPGVQFAPDGKTVLIGTDDSLLVWDPVASQCVRTLPGRRGFNFTFSPDGKTVASLGGPVGRGFLMESVVHVWDLTTGKPHAANRPENGHVNPAGALAFSPDGRAVVSASRDDPNASDVRLWDATTGRPLRSPPVKGSSFFQALPFTPGGKEVLLRSDSAIVRWEIATGREVRRYSLGQKGQTNSDVTVVHLCDDGRTLLALEQHSNANANAKPPGNSDYALHAWDLATGARLRSVPLAVEERRWQVAWINYSRFSPDGRLFVNPSGRIHDTITGAEVARLSVAGKSLEKPVAFSPDGALIALGVQDQIKQNGISFSGVGAIQLWEVATLAPVARLATGAVAHIAFTPDGRRLIAAGPDALTLWDIPSGEVVVRRPAPGRFSGTYGPSFASSLAVAAHGRTVATGNADTTILLWDLSPPAPHGPAAPLDAAQREACWAALAGADAGRALAAIARLADEPAHTVRMLRDQLHPAKAPPAEELCRLLADLDDERFERRQAATKRLAELGDLAQSALSEVLERKPSLEVRRRIENLLAAARLVQSPDERRHLRAVRILEGIGTREARQVLERLAQGASEARVTRQAKATLARLARRSKP